MTGASTSTRPGQKTSFLDGVASDFCHYLIFEVRLPLLMSPMTSLVPLGKILERQTDKLTTQCNAPFFVLPRRRRHLHRSLPNWHPSFYTASASPTGTFLWIQAEPSLYEWYPFLSYGTSTDGKRSFLILSLEPTIRALLVESSGGYYSSSGCSCSDVDLKESFMGGMLNARAFSRLLRVHPHQRVNGMSSAGLGLMLQLDHYGITPSLS